MPAGELLADRVAAVLDPQQGKTCNEIGAALDPPVTPRAVRYAVQLLFADGRAKKVGPKIVRPGNKQFYKVLAAIPEAPSAQAAE